MQILRQFANTIAELRQALIRIKVSAACVCVCLCAVHPRAVLSVRVLVMGALKNRLLFDSTNLPKQRLAKNRLAPSVAFGSNRRRRLGAARDRTISPAMLISRSKAQQKTKLTFV